MNEGIYACRAQLHFKDDRTEGPFDAVMHFGPRPVFKDTKSCEVHLLDHVIPSPPLSVTVTVLDYIRDVRDFPSVEALKEEIARDIEKAKDIFKRTKG